MAAKAAHVVMLQRSPTYFRVGRNAIEIAEELRTLGISEDWIHEITRRKILFEQVKFAKQTFTQPEMVKEALLEAL
jgi:cation diffusion facilitator CzcD-associated flavoprotein CzcO